MLCHAAKLVVFCAEYHDLALFQEPHKGQAEVRAFFEKVTRTLPRDLNFAVDAISDGEPGAACFKQLQQQLKLRLCSKHCWLLSICFGTARWLVPELCCCHFL